MLESTTLRDPLLLRHVAIERRPAVLCGFVDASEMAVVKDMAPHLVVHDGLDALAPDEGTALDMLAALVDAEAEDPIEGEKHLLVLRNAPLDTIATVAARFPAGWVASTTATASDAARRLGVPVFDVRAGAWVNVDPSGLDLSWEAGLLAGAGGGQGLRMALRGFFTAAMLVASTVASGDEAGAAGIVEAQLAGEAARQALVAALPAHFGIGTGWLAAAAVHVDPPAPAPPPPPATPSPAVPSPSPAMPGAPAVAAPHVAAPHPSPAFSFFHGNPAFARAFVHVLGKHAGQGTVDPASAFASLQAGAWRDGLPAGALLELATRVLSGASDVDAATGLAAALEQALVAFHLATRDQAAAATRQAIASLALPPARPAGPARGTGATVPRWGGLPPVPRGPGADLVAWIDVATRKIAAWQDVMAGILTRNGLPVVLLPPPYQPAPRPARPVETWTADEACAYLSAALPAVGKHLAALLDATGAGEGSPVVVKKGRARTRG